MSWGTELWDQYDNLASHTQKGIDFLEKYGNFVRDRCTIEMEYAGKLKRLVKNYQPKRKEEDEYQYTPCKAFRLLLDELSDLAGQREVVAENLQANVLRELHLLAKELRDERKKHLSDGAKQTATLAASAAALERARRSYERAAREAERALDAYQRADADLNLSRAEVEKQRAHMASRAQQAEDARADYAAQRNKTNEMQRAHYGQMMPQVFKMLQDLDEKRIKNIKNFMLSSVVIERNVFPIISKCLDGMDAAANCINEKEDTSLVIERYKSGFLPPADYPLEEAGRGSDTADGAAQPGAPLAAYHATAPRGTISGGKIKKRVGLLSIFSSNKNNISTDGKEDYSDLPPNQRRKKLAAKVQELRKQVSQEQAVMDGLMKMKGVYEANSALGDPMTVEGQLNECGHKLEKLKAALSKFQGWLEAAGSSAPQPCAAPAPAALGLNGGGHRHSIGSNSESLSRSASDSSVSTAGAPNPQPANGDCETGEGVEAQPEYYYEPELQPLGMCKALYPFEATSAGSMRMSCGESLLVVERDQGDGWTRVRRAHTHEEGFVPTTYIATTLFGDTG